MKKQLFILLSLIALLVTAQVPQRFNKVIVTGDITSPKFIKTGSNADSVLLGNGSARAISTVKTDTVSLSNRINAKATGNGTANGTNTGDETLTSIKTKLGAANSTTDGYIKCQDWSAFNSKQSALGFTPEQPLTFSTGLTRTGNTITNNITQYTDVLARAAQTNSSVITALGYTPWYSGNHPTTLSSYGITDTPWTSYLPLSGGTLSGALILKEGATNGLRFPADAYGGSGDTASITLQNPSGGEATRMTFTMTNDADDLFSFVAPSVNGMLMNGNVVWNAGNFNPASKLDYRTFGTAAGSAVGDFYATGSTVANSTAWGDNKLVNAENNNAPNYIIGTYSNAEAYYATSTALNAFIHGGLTTNYIPKWNGSNFVNSLVFDNGTNLGIGYSSDQGYKLAVNGTGYFNGALTATSFVKSGGTSAQFLKADGSVDGTAYKPNFSENTAFNKNFGTTPGTVLEGRTFGTAAGSAVGDFYATGSTVANSTAWGDNKLVNAENNNAPNYIIGTYSNAEAYYATSTALNAFIHGGLTTNYIPKWNGSNFVNAVSGADYQQPITLTTNGTSGAATFSGGVLNVPNYGGGGGTGGSFTPSITNLSNVSSITSNFGNYISIGGATMLSFSVDMSIAGGAGAIRVSLPNTSTTNRFMVTSNTNGATGGWNSSIYGYGSHYVDITVQSGYSGSMKWNMTVTYY